MIRWTGLAPWEFEFPFPGSLTSTFIYQVQKLYDKQKSGPPVRVSYFRLIDFVSLNSRLESHRRGGRRRSKRLENLSTPCTLNPEPQTQTQGLENLNETLEILGVMVEGLWPLVWELGLRVLESRGVSVHFVRLPSVSHRSLRGPHPLARHPAPATSNPQSSILHPEPLRQAEVGPSGKRLFNPKTRTLRHNPLKPRPKTLRPNP